MTRTLHTIIQVLLAVSAGILTAMMLLTAIDVVMRYAFRLPIPGAFELTEYMMAFIVPFSIAYCAEQKGHVSVELFFKKLPKIIQTVLAPVISLLTLIFAILITWQNILYIFETAHDRISSAVLLIPIYPFIIPVSIGAGGYAMVVAFQLLQVKKDGRHTQ
jgi:TRAP-type C4-dicarboxylate transport system permease small subunit